MAAAATGVDGLAAAAAAAAAANAPASPPLSCRPCTRGFQKRFRLFVNQFVSCFSSMPVSLMMAVFSASVGYGCAMCAGDRIQACPKSG
jgi:hypothetical protein